MNPNDIHFLREILLTNYLGHDVPTMQVSGANAECVNPPYRAAAFYESESLRALYHELGGSRRDDARMGATVILPHRSRWARLWRVSASQVQVIDNPNSPTVEMLAQQQEKAIARNRQMRG